MNITQIAHWFEEHRITEVECMIPDFAGVPRGKILPTKKFLSGLQGFEHRLPESILTQGITGEWPDEDYVAIADHDVILVPDMTTVRHVPWYSEPTAQIICDCRYFGGAAVDIYSRQILRHVLSLYHAEGWQPVVAPELEFYLVQKNTNVDVPLVPPVGKNGRIETARQSYGIDAVNEFDPIFEDVYDYCEKQNIDIDTLNHEAGAAQMEINFRHGDPLSLADQVFLFKRTVRQTALSHGIYATFMAKPMKSEPSSSMHIHHSVYDQQQRNIFSDIAGKPTAQFGHFVSGLQRHAAAAVPFFAPNINSYRRYATPEVAINNHWGVDNRTCGFRVPRTQPENRRIENRLCGADVNPYLGIAASLLCGYLGLREQIAPEALVENNAYDLPQNLPIYYGVAEEMLRQSPEMIEHLGEKFVTTYLGTKQVEFDNYAQVISSWEREHLLLNV